MRLYICVVAAALMSGGAYVPVAQACGGFFCNRTAPVSQAGEQIVFARDDDGTMTAHVRIEYEGGATDFAWILPVPSIPEIGISTEALFTAINRATAPRFNRDYRVDGTCRRTPDCEYPWESSSEPPSAYPRQDGSPGETDASEPTPPPVEVAFRGNVGPYDAAVIRSNDGVEALLEWLEVNSYDIPDETGPILAEYVADENYFVALRLQKDRGAGEIQPVELTFEEAQPCIPIKLTRLATIPDMPITAYILGSEVAASQNYARVTPLYDDAGLWTGGTNYMSYLSRQVDDVGGQAFVTEYAGNSPGIDHIILSRLDRHVGSGLSVQDLLRVLRNNGYSDDPQMLGILLRFIPPSEEWADDPNQFYNSVFFGDASLTEYLESLHVNMDEVLEAIDEAITTPRLDAAALLRDHPITTRLSTTMSADEMTLDPVFDLEPEAPRVSNLHTATEVTACSSRYFQRYAPRSLRLPSGRSISLDEGQRFTADEYCGRTGGVVRGSGPRSPGSPAGSICTVSGAPMGAGGVPAAVLIMALSCLWWRRRA